MPEIHHTTPINSSLSSEYSCKEVCTDPACNIWDATSIHDSDTCSLGSCLSPEVCESSRCCREETCIRQSDDEYQCGPSCLKDDRLEPDEFADFIDYDLESTDQPIPCQWLETDQQCPVSASPAALSLHVTKDHIDPNAWLPCGWSHCDQTVESQHILEHVSQDHRPDQYVCLWQGCGYSFSSGEELATHMSTMHTPKLDCHWGGCDFSLMDPDALKVHVNDEHLNMNFEDFHQDTGDDVSFASFSSPSRHDLVLASDSGPHFCQWMDGSVSNKTCGASFQHENDLQDHMEKIHINDLSKGGSYVCRWQDCSGFGNPHNGKHRLRKHMWTHTGCKIPRGAL